MFSHACTAREDSDTGYNCESSQLKDLLCVLVCVLPFIYFNTFDYSDLTGLTIVSAHPLAPPGDTHNDQGVVCHVPNSTSSFF